MFDDLTRLAAQICDTPIAMISLIGEAWQSFNTQIGMDATELPRWVGFRTHATLDLARVLIVPDATKDPRFSSDELVTGITGIRFYAGAPLIGKKGEALGALCVIDRQARELTQKQVDGLAALARQVVSQIQLREKNAALQQARIEQEEFFTRPLDMLCIAGADGYFKLLNPAFSQTLGFSNEELLARPIFDFVHPDDVAATQAEMNRVVSGLAAVNFEHRFRCKDGSYRWLSWKCAPARDGILHASARDVTERKAALQNLEQSEARLAASEQRFRGIFHGTFNFIGLLAPDGTLLEANQTALDLIGAQRADVIGLPFAETPWWSHSRAEQGKLREAIQQAAQGETVRFETTHPNAEGGLRHVDFTLKPARDAQGRVVQLVPEGRDITEHRIVQESLAASEELLRQFIRHTPAAIAMLDRQMRYVQTSHRWLTDYHLHEREIIGRSHYEIFPDVPQRWKAIHQRVLAGAVERCDEDPFPRGDGGMEWLQWEARPWRKAGGEIGGIIFYTQVITARKLAEAQLRESEERFRGAFQNSAIGMALVSLEGHWLRVNRAICEIVGRTEEELLACTFQDITHPEDLEADLSHVRALLAGETDHYQIEKRYFHKDGHTVWILLAVTLVHGSDGRPVHFVSQIEDITDRRQAAQRLQASLEEKEVLLREIHHRVKNNLQVITSLLQLQSGYLRDPQDVAIFEECQARIHAMGLVHDRLYRSGNLATIDFSEHLRDLTALLVRGHSSAPERIRLVLESEPVEVDLDTAIPLGLITAELITNAYKHAFGDRHEGVITVRLARMDGRLTLAVEDDGVGLPAGFEPEKARSLGLRLIRALARQLRAELSILSSGSGSRIQLTFQIERA